MNPNSNAAPDWQQQQGGQVAGAAFQEDLCGCFNDMTSCCITCCCPAIQYGLNAEQLDGSGCALNCLIYYLMASLSCCCLVHMQRRQLLREQYGIADDGSDCWKTTFCPVCAICQESREIKARGPPPKMMMAGQQRFMHSAPAPPPGHAPYQQLVDQPRSPYAAAPMPPVAAVAEYHQPHTVHYGQMAQSPQPHPQQPPQQPYAYPQYAQPQYAQPQMPYQAHMSPHQQQQQQQQPQQPPMHAASPAPMHDVYQYQHAASVAAPAPAPLNIWEQMPPQQQPPPAQHSPLPPQ